MDAVGDLYHHSRRGVRGQGLTDHAAVAFAQAVRLRAARAEQRQARRVDGRARQDDEPCRLLLDGKVAVEVEDRLCASLGIERDAKRIALRPDRALAGGYGTAQERRQSRRLGTVGAAPSVAETAVDASVPSLEPLDGVYCGRRWIRV